MSQSLRNRMTWDTDNGQILDDTRRYVIIRNDVLMGIFSRLDASSAAQALAAFENSVMQSGGQSARAYFNALGNDVNKLLDTMVAFSAELGWGVWSFSRTAAALELTVRNSPFAAGHPKPSAGPVCHPIVGMLRTVGELVFDNRVEVRETQCCCHEVHGDVCRFSIAAVHPENP
ncbi:MAG: hypothetical protein GX086_04375 [Alcaligenaceae bacterium]|nr:hypothetical protein [Alcaligenaceae bacterium]